MAFGEFLAISPSQVLAAEAEDKRREQEAAQFAAKMQDLAQARAAEREAALATKTWERQKWGTEQERLGKTAAFERQKYGEAPGRAMAIEEFKAGLKSWEPKTQAEQIAWLMEKGGIEAAKAGKWGTEGGIQTQSVTGEQKLAPVVKKDYTVDPADPRYQISPEGKRELISTPTPEPEVWWEDPSRPGWQISNRGGERVRQETGEEQTARKLKEIIAERTRLSEMAGPAGLGLESITGGGMTYKKPTPEPTIPPGFEPTTVRVGPTTYAPPKPEKPLAPTWGERNKIMKELATLVDDGEIKDSDTLTLYIESQGLKADDPAFAALYKRISKQIPKKSFWSSLGEAIKPGRARKSRDPLGLR